MFARRLLSAAAVRGRGSGGFAVPSLLAKNTGAAATMATMPKGRRRGRNPPAQGIDIVLLEDVSGRGEKGQVVKVKRGYMRNFLYPRRKAVYATPENREQYEDESKAALMGGGGESEVGGKVEKSREGEEDGQNAAHAPRAPTSPPPPLPLPLAPPALCPADEKAAIKDSAKVIERLSKVELTVFRWDPSFGEGGAAAGAALPQPVTRRHVAEKLWKQATFMVYPEDIRILGLSANQSAVGGDEDEVFEDSQSVAEAAASFRAEQEAAEELEAARRAAIAEGGDDAAAAAAAADAAAAAQRDERGAGKAFDRTSHANRAVDRAWEEATEAAAAGGGGGGGGSGQGSPSSEEMQAELRKRFAEGRSEGGEVEGEAGEGDDVDAGADADADDQIFTEACAAAAEKAKATKGKKKGGSNSDDTDDETSGSGFGTYDLLVRCSAEGDVAPVTLRILRLNEKRSGKAGAGGAGEGGEADAAAAAGMM